MPAVDVDLSTLFALAEVHDDVVTYLASQGVVSVTIFANLIDKSDEIERIMAATAQRDQPVEAAKLKRCWRMALAVNESKHVP